MQGKTAAAHNNWAAIIREAIQWIFRAVPSSYHLLFFPESFSVFVVSLVHWTAIILWHWPLLSIFCLHPSSHYTQSKGKPQRMLDNRSRSKQQITRSKQDDQIYQALHVFSKKKNQCALSKQMEDLVEMSVMLKGEKWGWQNRRRWSWITVAHVMVLSCLFVRADLLMQHFPMIFW